MSLSRKLPVINLIARDLIGEDGNPKPGKSLVVTTAMINEACLSIGDANLARTNKGNFSKDFLRPQAEIEWLPWLTALKWTMRQKYGPKNQGVNFEFVPFVAGQTEPHPNHFPHAHLQSPVKVSPSRVKRKLREKSSLDEMEVILVCEQSDLLNTHFAQSDRCEVEILEHDTYNKKGWVEIDALYQGRVLVDGIWHPAIICVEAKGEKDRVLLDQLKAQVAKCAVDARGDKADQDQKAAVYVVSIAVTVRKFGSEKRICIHSSEPVSIDLALQHYENDTLHLIPFQVQSEGSYSFNPPLRSL
jgi:hypothetical protein